MMIVRRGCVDHKSDAVHRTASRPVNRIGCRVPTAERLGTQTLSIILLTYFISSFNVYCSMPRPSCLPLNVDMLHFVLVTAVV